MAQPTALSPTLRVHSFIWVGKVLNSPTFRWRWRSGCVSKELECTTRDAVKLARQCCLRSTAPAAKACARYRGHAQLADTSTNFWNDQCSIRKLVSVPKWTTRIWRISDAGTGRRSHQTAILGGFLCAAMRQMVVRLTLISPQFHYCFLGSNMYCEM